MSKTARELVRRLQKYEDPLRMPAAEIKHARQELSKEEYFDGKKLKTLREARNISQKDLAQLVHMSPSGVGRAERGEDTPFASQTEKIAEYFGVAPDFFVSVRYLTSSKKGGRPKISRTFMKQDSKAKNRKFRKGTYNTYKVG